MSRVCEVCQKEYQKANSVPRGIGRRVTNRAIKKQKPNLRVKRFKINGNKVKVRLCASCLKRVKFEEKKLKEQKNKE